MKRFLLKCAGLKIDLLSDHQIHCFVGMYVCMFEPGNFMGMGSEGVKLSTDKVYENTMFCNNASHLLTKWCPVSENVSM